MAATAAGALGITLSPSTAWLSSEHGEYKVSGLLASLHYCFPDHSCQFFYVNGRFCHNRYLPSMISVIRSDAGSCTHVILRRSTGHDVDSITV